MSTTPEVKEMLLQQLLPRLPLLPLHPKPKYFHFPYCSPYITQTSCPSHPSVLPLLFSEHPDHVLEKPEWGKKPKLKTNRILKMEGNYKPSPIWSTD